jgi:transposase-like protein
LIEPEVVKQAAKMIRSGARGVDIAKELNVHQSTVSCWRKLMGMTRARRDKMDAEILSDANTMTVEQIAEKYGYCRANIYRVLKKHHVPAVGVTTKFKERLQIWQHLRA